MRDLKTWVEEVLGPRGLARRGWDKWVTHNEGEVEKRIKEREKVQRGSDAKKRERGGGGTRHTEKSAKFVEREERRARGAEKV